MKLSSLPSLSLLALVQVLSVSQASGESICTSAYNTFTVKVDIFASERGYYQFEECGEVNNPVIGLEIGEVYTFTQKDRTNFWHPLRFSYFPDGHHLGGNLLSPDSYGKKIATTGGTDHACTKNNTCSAPMYFLNDAYLGRYSNIPEEEDLTTNETDYGFKLYEDFFFRKMATWTGFGTFSMKLKFDHESYDKDIFYYCHAHQFMAGRIKLLKNGVPVNEQDEPAMYYPEEAQGEFDKICGVSLKLDRHRDRREQVDVISTRDGPDAGRVINDPSA